MSLPPPAPLSPAELEAFLHGKIPLSQAMGVRVIESGTRVLLEAPLNLNINHLGTAFGGSLHTLPTLAGYAAVWILLREAGLEGHVVLKRSAANYRQPVTGALRAVCARPDPEIAAKFIADFGRHGKARLELSATVEGSGGKPAVEFQGTFVALA